jgi:exopolysaccharide biosynthesis polyprenyl glycosylphosphotransferase
MAHKQSRVGITIALDVVLINLSFVLSYIVRYQLQIPYPVEEQYYAPFYPYTPFAALLTLLCLMTYRIEGLYEIRRGRRWLDEVYRLISGTMVSIVLIMAITFFLQPLVYSRGMLVLAGFLIVASLSLERLIQHVIEAGRRRKGIGVDRVLIIGAGELGRAVMRSILADPSLGYRIVGYLDDDPTKGNGSLGRFKGLGPLDKLSDVLPAEKVDEVIVTLPWMYHRKIMQIVDECERHKVRVRVVPDVFQQRLHYLDLESLNGIPLIGPGPARMSSSAFILKRVIDLSVVIITLPLWSLLFLVIGALIKLDSRGPVLYKQIRVGRNGQEFYIYKFRSMILGADEMKAELEALNEADGPLFKIKDDPRLTRLGRLLRRTSLDELPQVINVLRGEMSLVGPRPGTPEEVSKYEPWQRARISVRPGMTGLWQVSGRSNLPFDEMCLLDIFYIENWSLDLDVRILLQTIPNVILGHGAY